MLSFYDIERRKNLTVVNAGAEVAPTHPHGYERLVAAIGNFDGVHLGHAKVIGAAIDYAHKENLTPAVITFRPHPRQFFNPEDDGFALADEEDKLSFLAALGVEIVINLTFDEAMRSTSAEDFVTSILARLKVSDLFAGSDFTFGKERAGNLDMISKLGQNLTAHPIALETSKHNTREIISSSSIRQAVMKGDVKTAAHLLGRPVIISGKVIEGDKQGRIIGFPTANLKLGEMQKPAFGVYTISARLADQGGKIYSGVANLGIRPTAPDRGVLLEVNLFDYDGDLYGQRLNVFLLDFIRPERKFDHFEALKEQITQDAETARQFHHG